MCHFLLQNIIKLADKLGLSDDGLFQSILIYLNKNKSEVYYSVSPKKNHIKSVMYSLSLQASTEEESVKDRTELAKFSRQPGELFPDTISRFDSL